MRHGKDALLLFDEIFDVDLVLHVLDFGAAVVAELVADGDELFLEDGFEKLLVGQQPQIVRDALFQLFVLVFQLLALEPLQPLELHVKHHLCLNLGQAEALHQTLLRVVVALADGLDDLVNVVLGDEQSLQHMLAVLRLFELILGAPGDDLLLERQIFVENVPQRQNTRLRLIIDQRQHRHAERGLHLRLGKQAV